MDNYTVKLMLYEEITEDILIPSSVEIKFFFNDFEFGSHKHNFDGINIYDVNDLIDAMNGNKQIAKIFQEFNDGYCSVTIKNKIITFETTHFYRKTKMRFIINESLISVYKTIFNFYVRKNLKEKNSIEDINKLFENDTINSDEIH